MIRQFFEAYDLVTSSDTFMVVSFFVLCLFALFRGHRKVED